MKTLAAATCSTFILRVVEQTIMLRSRSPQAHGKETHS
jgi:hypothetical protein